MLGVGLLDLASSMLEEVAPRNDPNPRTLARLLFAVPAPKLAVELGVMLRRLPFLPIPPHVLYGEPAAADEADRFKLGRVSGESCELAG